MNAILPAEIKQNITLKALFIHTYTRHLRKLPSQAVDNLSKDDLLTKMIKLQSVTIKIISSIMRPVSHQTKIVMKPEPKSEAELLERARNVAGLSFAELALEAGMDVPPDLRRDKGWVGQLLEWHLGATAGSKPQQDFEQLGIELKTIPISYTGKPLETTFVCVAPLVGVQGLRWENSHVRNKLSRVLWVPVEGEREIPLSQRRVGSPLIWSPTEAQEYQLKTDWEELMEMIVVGQVEQITARHGEVLQLRPKAANGRVLTEAYGASGKHIKTRPRGFYLRTQFTAKLLEQHFV